MFSARTRPWTRLSSQVSLQIPSRLESGPPSAPIDAFGFVLGASTLRATKKTTSGYAIDHELAARTMHAAAGPTQRAIRLSATC